MSRVEDMSALARSDTTFVLLAHFFHNEFSFVSFLISFFISSFLASDQISIREVKQLEKMASFPFMISHGNYMKFKMSTE